MQWLKLCASNARERGAGSIPGQGANTPHDLQPRNQNIKWKQYCNKFNKDFKNGSHPKKSFRKEIGFVFFFKEMNFPPSRALCTLGSPSFPYYIPSSFFIHSDQLTQKEPNEYEMWGMERMAVTQ